MSQSNKFSVAFNKAFENVIGVEGGFSDDPKDPGNWTGGKEGIGKLNGTKYGVSAAAYPSLEIKTISLDDAKAIYHRDYWQVINGDEFPFSVANALFDCAVNSGCASAAKLFQKALGVSSDGKIGKQTIAAAQAKDPTELLIDFLTARAVFYARLAKFELYGKGWMKRLFTVFHQSQSE
jgi:lysozyme family protein